LLNRVWRCGLNVAEPRNGGTPGWQARVLPPDLPRLRLVLEYEKDVPPGRYPRLKTDGEAAALCWRLLQRYEREAVAALFLDSRRRLIGYDIPYVGTLSQAEAEPRGVLVPAMLVNAAQVVVAHNHPGGDPTPSDKDRIMTARLVEAGHILGIPVTASLVVAEQGRWCAIPVTRDPLQEIAAQLRNRAWNDI
jgi:DNA repair protein RadC